MVRSASMVVVLFAFWVLLSGHLETLMLSLGIVSTLLAVWIVRRMDAIDREPHPLRFRPRLLAYWAWLTGQVVRANLDVARRILHPRMPISPRVIRLRTSQRTAAGQVTYANSITLTPGTITMDVRGDEVEVYALTAEAAEELRSGEMDRRVTALEETPS